MNTMGIEEFLEWAFTQELWKVGAGGGVSVGPRSSYQAISNYAELGTLIYQEPNEFGLLPGFQDGAPHPDALRAGMVVKGLPAFELPQADSLLSDWSDPFATAAAAVDDELERWHKRGEDARRQHIVNMVISCSILGRGPDWHAAHPGDEMAVRHGKPAWFIKKSQRDSLGVVRWFEFDGYDSKNKRPMPGAYRKWKLKRPIRADVQARIDWIWWQSALYWLRDELKDGLTDHLIRDFNPRFRIWQGINAPVDVPQVFENAAQ